MQDQEELWDRYEQSMRKLLDPIREYEGQFEGAEDKIEEFQEVRRQYLQVIPPYREYLGKKDGEGVTVNDIMHW